MSVFSNLDNFVPSDGISNACPDVLDRNWQTTTAVGLTVATGGVTGAIMLAAFPAQTLATAGTITGLAVAGKRRADGKDPMFGLLDRFQKKEADKTTDVKEPAAEPAAA